MKLRKKPRSSLPSSLRLQPLTDLTIPRQAQAHAPLSPMRDKEPDSFKSAASGELPEAPRSPPRAALEVEEKVGPLEAGSGCGDKEELTSDAGGGGGSEGQLTDVDAAARPSDGGSEAKDGILEPPSDGGDNEKEGILESSDGVWSMDTVAEEKDYDTAVGGEVVVVREATVAEEKKNGALGDATVAHDIEEKKDVPSSAEKWDGLSNVGAVVTIAVAGTAGETVLERKEGDSSVTVAIAPKKQGIPRTSCYHGVTRHRWTGKYEAHLWDGSINIESRKRKGKQVYLGGYDTEEKAARAYDLAALKYWGINAGTKLNFPISDYGKELEEMKNMNQDEWVASLRRRSTCFSRGVSAYRGVTRRRKDGKWQARLGSVAGTRDIYLGAFNTEEEAAVAYDIAAVELRGPTAVTNFDISNYLEGDLRRLEASPSMKL